MRTNRFLWISISVVLCFFGAYLVFNSMQNSGEFAEAGILFGGTLIALALFTTIIAVGQHIHLRALARHMRHSSRAPRA